jgi:hypothetical protein
LTFNTIWPYVIAAESATAAPYMHSYLQKNIHTEPKTTISQIHRHFRQRNRVYMLHRKGIIQSIIGFCVVLLIFGGIVTILGSGGSDDGPAPTTYRITCDEVRSSPVCTINSIRFVISGLVSASDGSSLAGVSLEMSYTNEIASGGTQTVSAGTVTVASDQTFRGDGQVATPVGESWNDPEGRVTVSFSDPATYGNAECSLDFVCTPAGISDIRLKTDIHPLGETDQGIKLYRFRYINDPAKLEYVGVMAQDLTISHPHALAKSDDGYYAVRYDLLGLKMATYKEWQRAGLKAVKLME